MYQNLKRVRAWVTGIPASSTVRHAARNHTSPKKNTKGGLMTNTSNTFSIQAKSSKKIVTVEEYEMVDGKWEAFRKTVTTTEEDATPDLGQTSPYPPYTHPVPQDHWWQPGRITSDAYEYKLTNGAKPGEELH